MATCSAAWPMVSSEEKRENNLLNCLLQFSISSMKRVQAILSNSLNNYLAIIYIINFNRQLNVI